MPIQDEKFDTWATMHASVYAQARALLRSVAAEPRAHGALRYRCPVTGSFVLLTDEPTLAALARPPARLRCADCGEVHLITVEEADSAVMAAPADKP
jgi:hypothetical protein